MLVVESYWLKNKLKSVSRNKVERAKTPGERLCYIVFGLDFSEIKKLWAESVTTDTDFDAKLVWKKGNQERIPKVLWEGKEKYYKYYKEIWGALNNH